MSDPIESTSTLPSSPARAATVEASFTDRTTLVRAVERLAEKSVPADSISVFVHDGSGGRREVAVEDEPGALRGALIGAVVGAVTGLAISIAVAAGMLGSVDVGIISARGLTGALRAMAAGAAAAVPLGALLGMGHWRGRKKIEAEELRSGKAVVIVESDELSELAREVLKGVGGSDVRVRGRADG